MQEMNNRKIYYFYCLCGIFLSAGINLFGCMQIKAQTSVINDKTKQIIRIEENTKASEEESTTEIEDEENKEIPFRKAGTIVEEQEIQKNGVSAYFISSEISDDIFARMIGKSFGEDCTILREDLRYLTMLYCGPDKKSYVGEMVCHKEISEDLLEIFQELYQQSYPIEKMVLIDDYDGEDLQSEKANNTSCFNFRLASGPSGNLSRHAYGKAVDINPLYNPYLWTDSEGERHCEPEESLIYADRTETFSYKIEKDDLCCRLFLEHGFVWGGNWNYEKDYMHFSIP